LILQKKIAIFVDWFAPGYKGGGQIQSCVNLALSIQDDLEVFVVTTDRDLGETQPYPSITPNVWTKFDRRIKVIYLSPDQTGYKSIKRLLLELDPEIVYLNSMFSVNLTLIPLEVCRANKWKPRVILAPRGMLHAGALQYKKLKKQLFFKAFKLRNFHKRLLFHATDATEANDIAKVFGKAAKFTFIEDFPASRQEPLSVIAKAPGELQCLFVSRISPKKNLSFLLELLMSCRGNYRLTIVGPAEDAGYWDSCQDIIRRLPENVRVDYKGAIANSALSKVYQANHVFILPTFGENFGHVIFESLLNGRPVILSDRTPWRNLQEQNAGWDISLNDKASFVNAIEAACALNQEEFSEMCSSSWKLAAVHADTSELKHKYLSLFLAQL
jgi:glycosyltransferase involved in cell wall biosynthesis